MLPSCSERDALIGGRLEEGGTNVFGFLREATVGFALIFGDGVGCGSGGGSEATTGGVGTGERSTAAPTATGCGDGLR